MPAHGIRTNRLPHRKSLTGYLFLALTHVSVRLVNRKIQRNEGLFLEFARRTCHTFNPRLQFHQG